MNKGMLWFLYSAVSLGPGLQGQKESNYMYKQVIYGNNYILKAGGMAQRPPPKYTNILDTANIRSRAFIAMLGQLP